MNVVLRAGAMTIALMLVCRPALAQRESVPPDPGFSLTPYVGVLIPTEDLIQATNGVPLKLAAAIVFGGRLGISLGQRWGIDGDVGYSPGSLEADSTGFKANQDVKVLSGSGRLTFYLIPRSYPLWLGVSGGVGAVRHTFSQSASSSTTNVSDGTNVGGVFGASAGIRLGRLLAVNVGAEDYLYDASFDVSGTKTAERKQHDIRLSAGVRIPFLGM
jgi:hypothetical protein